MRSYRHWDVLPRAIESAKAQTGQRFIEGVGSFAILGVVPIEDERTTAIFREHGVDVIHTAEPCITGQANAGFRAADSDYVYPLDSDDYLHSNALLSLVAIAQARSAAVVYSDYEKWSSDGFEIIASCSNENQDLRHACFIPEACLYNRATWLGLGGYDSSLWRFAQWDYFLRVAQNKLPIVHLPFIGFRYSMSPTQLTSRIHRGEYKAKDDPAWKRFVTKHDLKHAETVGHGSVWYAGEVEEAPCPA